SVFMTNEGNFGDSNGMINSFDPQTGESIQKAFENINGRPFAGIIQDSDVHGNRMYLAANVADKIEIINKRTLEGIKTFEMSSAPISIEVIDDKTAYVGLIDGTVSIMDLTTGEITKTLEEYQPPRTMVQVVDKTHLDTHGIAIAS